jgi:hypothetical protein
MRVIPPSTGPAIPAIIPPPRLPEPHVTEPQADLIHARYRDPAIAAGLEINPVLETILRHSSCRAFLPDRIPPATLEAIRLLRIRDGRFDEIERLARQAVELARG